MIGLGETKAERKWAGRKQSQVKQNQSARGREWTQLPFEIVSSSSVENHPEACLPQMGRRIARLAVLWSSAPGARRASPGPGKWTLCTWEEYTHWSTQLLINWILLDAGHQFSAVQCYKQRKNGPKGDDELWTATHPFSPRLTITNESLINFEALNLNWTWIAKRLSYLTPEKWNSDNRLSSVF